MFTVLSWKSHGNFRMTFPPPANWCETPRKNSDIFCHRLTPANYFARHFYGTRLSFVFNFMSFMCHLSIICVTRMSVVCAPLPFVYLSYVLVCHLYVILMYSYVTHMSLLCTSMSFACHLYIIRMSLVCTFVSLVCIFTMNP